MPVKGGWGLRFHVIYIFEKEKTTNTLTAYYKSHTPIHNYTQVTL